MENFEIRKDLFYSKSHEWVQFNDDGTALLGLTDFAQQALTALVFVELPKKGRPVTNGKAYGNVESYKAVSPVYSQLTGIVADINEELEDEPQNINEKPYESWIIKVSDITEKGELMNADEYEKYCEEAAKELE